MRALGVLSGVGRLGRYTGCARFDFGSGLIASRYGIESLMACGWLEQKASNALEAI